MHEVPCVNFYQSSFLLIFYVQLVVIFYFLSLFLQQVKMLPSLLRVPKIIPDVFAQCARAGYVWLLKQASARARFCIGFARSRCRYPLSYFPSRRFHASSALSRLPVDYGRECRAARPGRPVGDWSAPAAVPVCRLAETPLPGHWLVPSAKLCRQACILYMNHHNRNPGIRVRCFISP